MITRDTVKDKIVEVEARIELLKKEREIMPDEYYGDFTLKILELERRKANLLRLQV